jgi:mannose-6-phosphate isomerase class I
VSTPEPVLLRPTNFTPPSRTPWGGTRLSRHLKRAFVSPGEERVIGESWEVSIEPDFPGRLDDGRSLADYISEDPLGVLGVEALRGRRGTALLVKYIDASEPLSVQIHPSDDYAGLARGECGKPESWYVIAREPGAGLYLGFQRGTVESDVRSALAEGRSLETLLRFVPVEPGDFFLIEAGTPHAIGAGLTLVEPQHVLPGRRGVTYRYWDWDRRYDAQGRPDPLGNARPLHVEHALSVTSWTRVQADDFIESIRLRAGPPALSDAPSEVALAGDGGLQSEFLRVARVTGSGMHRLPAAHRMHAITVVEGAIQVAGLKIEQGRSAVVPACLAGAAIELRAAHAIVCAIA